METTISFVLTPNGFKQNLVHLLQKGRRKTKSKKEKTNETMNKFLLKLHVNCVKILIDLAVYTGNGCELF